MELTPRKERILSSVVAGYIKSGEPVGSKALADEVGVSSATVRNEMAGLIELGLLEQPHTSAGRIPSQKGYREYVDHLMKVPELKEEERRAFDSMLLSGSYDPEKLLGRASRLLSGVTRCVGIATTPSGDAARVKAVQFVQTSRRTAMLILMSSAGTMKNRVFHCDFDLTNDILRVFFRVFNGKLAGKAVADITPALLQGIGVSLGQMYVLMGAPMRALLEVARDTMGTEVFLGGQMNLLFYPELEHGGARRVMDLLERREDLVLLLRQRPGHVVTRIGRELGRPELDKTSLAVSRYLVDGQDAGALAVLGPVRMDYPRVTAVLQYVAAQVGQQLTVLMKDE